MKKSEHEDPRKLIQYKFVRRQMIHVQMMTDKQIQELKKEPTLEYCKIM